MNSKDEEDLSPGRIVMHGIPMWRVVLAAPFLKLGIWILGGQNITLEKLPRARGAGKPKT